MDKLQNATLLKKITSANLRTKVMLAVFIPTLLVLVGVFSIHAIREWQEWEDVSEESATQLAELALRGLHNAMLTNNKGTVSRIVKNFGQQPSIERIWVVDEVNKVAQSSVENELSKVISTDEAGCIECHQYPPTERPRVVQLRLQDNFLRVVLPIANEEACYSCHSPEKAHLGVLIIDKSLTKLEGELREDLLINFLISVITILIIMGILYFLIRWLIQRRISVVSTSFKAFAAGDFSTRIRHNWRTTDEITELAVIFNQMADELERYNLTQHEIMFARQQAIVEERERIARDLHDGVLQVLGYVKNKISAVGLLVEQNKLHAAQEQISQIESAVNNETGEIRNVIIGLRMVGQDETNFVGNLRKMIDMLQQMCDSQIHVQIASETNNLMLEPTREIQLLRITQEAINNARKHAGAAHVTISLTRHEDNVILRIEDDGAGFNPWKRSLWQAPHFGLSSMSERAEQIGASFEIISSPGNGTVIQLRFAI